MRNNEYHYFLRLLEAASEYSCKLMLLYLPLFQRRALKLALASTVPSISLDLLAVAYGLLS